MNCKHCGHPEAEHTYETRCIANPQDGIFGRLLLLTSYAPKDAEDDSVESLLAEAQRAQSVYWDALHALELALGHEIELDHVGGDLSAETVKSLREQVAR